MQLQEIKDLDRKYYMPVFGERFDVCFVSGEGAVLTDTEGKQYVDFLGGIAVNLLGYSDAGLTRVLQEQVARLMHVSNYFYVESQARAAQLLCEATGYGRAFFANSGAEAIEGALKLARKFYYARGEHKYEVITMQNSFHGRTLATLSATGQAHFQEPYQPLMPSFVHVPYNDVGAIRAAVTPNTCAVLLEPVLGEGGVIPAVPGYLQAVRALCDELDILMIADEVQTGMGRTGALLATGKAGVKADIVTLAKALGGGMPIGAFLAREHVAQAFAPGDHGSTFGGNHLATAAALYVLEQLTQTDLLSRVQSLGQYFLSALQKLAFDYPACTVEARGEGLMLGLSLAGAIPVKQMVKQLLKKGFVVGSAGGNTLRFVPPFVITEAQIDSLCTAIAAVFSQQ